MFDHAEEIYRAALDEIERDGLTKPERVVVSPQGAVIRTTGEWHMGAALGPSVEVINFCANNYLGLAAHPRVLEAARRALTARGFGLSSVRFICGTQDVHKELEVRIARFFRTEDAILYSSCFDANGGLFETLLGDEDAVVSDALNHASIIDGIRLCRAERHRYPSGDMAALEEALRKTAGKRLRLIATDGVFSMDGCLAKLDRICDLADRYHAMVMVDDSHATGFIGPTGRGTAEHFGVMERVDIVTGTFGKALGGASGGFTTGRRAAIELLRQRSRPYLFSNTLAPAIAMATLIVFDLLEESDEPRTRLLNNARTFRQSMTDAGFQIAEGFHPIVPVMLGEAQLAKRMAAELLKEGIYVIGFSYPVVPKGLARIRVQLSAIHEDAHIRRAVEAFRTVGRRLGVVA
jgi:glycine C-acetyltransferase